MSCVFRHVSEESADTKWHDVGETLLRLLWRYLMYLYTCSALCRNSSSRRVRIWMWWVAAWTLVFPCHTFASSPIAAMSHKVISSGVACLSLPAAPQYAQNVCIMFPCFFAFLSWSNSSNVHWLNAFEFVDSIRVFSPLLLLLILSNVPRVRGCLGYWVATVALNHVDVQARFAWPSQGLQATSVWAEQSVSVSGHTPLQPIYKVWKCTQIYKDVFAPAHPDSWT